MGFSNRSLFVQITDSAMRVLVGNKNKISEATTLKLEAGICNEGRILDRKKISDILSEYLELNAKDVNKISFVITGSDIITRTIEVPILKENALREAIYFEFSQFIPEIDLYYMNYEIIEKINTKEKKAYKLVLVAAKKDRLDVLVDISKDLGLELEAIDILSNSLSRALKDSKYLFSEESTAIIYLGADNSLVSIIENKSFKFERNLPYGINNIEEEASEEVAATIVQSIPRNNISSEYNKEKVTFESVLRNINNIIRFYNSDRNNREISNIVLVCIEDKAHGIERYFEKFFELPCVAIKETSDLNIKFKFEEGFAKFIPTYSLLVRGNDKKFLNLNPKVINKEESKENLDKTLVRITAIVLAGLVVSSIPFPIMNKVISKEMAGISSEIAKYEPIVAKNNELIANNAKMDNFIKRVNAVENSTTKTSVVISKLNTYVPKDISFMSMSFADTGTISISGEATTYNAIAEFLANLQMSGEFTNAKLSNITPMEKTVETATARALNSESDKNVEIEKVEEEAKKIAEDKEEAAKGKGSGSVETSSSATSNSNTPQGSNETTSTNNRYGKTTYSFSISIEEVSKDGTPRTVESKEKEAE